MKIMKKRKFIVAVSLALVMTFGVVMGYSFNTSTEVSAAQPSTRETPFDWGAFRQEINNLQSIFSYRFPNGDISDFDFGINFNGSFNRANENLEINLLNASLRIVSRTDELDEILLRRSPLVTLPYTNDRRIFTESNITWSIAHALATSSHGSSTVRTVYFWDNDASYNAIVTIYVPIYDGWLFEQANINLENGSLEMDESIKEFLAKNLNISIGNEDISGVNVDNTATDYLVDIWGVE